MKRIATLVLYLAFTAGVFAIPFEAAFSVSADKQVVFSMGNLQHHPKNGEWRFAANQYDYLSGANANLAADYDGWVDMFRWSTDNPAALWGVSASTTKSDYLGNFVDWGNNLIGSDTANTWYTLTADEWQYVFTKRANASALLGVAKVNNSNGIILLPDAWACPEGITFKSGFHTKYGASAFAEYQSFSAEEWAIMEQAGAVFLPVGGYLAPNGMYAVGSNGYYWSATKFQDEQAVYFDLQAKQVRRGVQFRYFGSAVRLVKTYVPAPKEPNTCLESTIILPKDTVMSMNLEGALDVYRVDYQDWAAQTIQIQWTGTEPLHLFIAKDCDYAVAKYHRDVVLYEAITSATTLDMVQLKPFTDHDGYLYVRFLTEFEGELSITAQ
jgi:hypothetical protein